MIIADRILCFEKLFEDLQSTNSRIEKDMIVDLFLSDYPELKEDWTEILKTLDNHYPIGWTFQASNTIKDCPFIDISSVIRYLFNFKDYNGLTIENCYIAERELGNEVGNFIAPIVNRTLRLGIGKSLLSKTELTPMLAKKYEGQWLHNDVFVTEKLDGNRCIAYWDGDKWQFKSRNGKDMKVNFDMSGLPEDFIYDGEVMSREQTELSTKRCAFNTTTIEAHNAQLMFNKTSGIINSHDKEKDLVYNIFDIVSEIDYRGRRQILDNLKPSGQHIRIIPVLYEGDDENKINELLDRIVSMGGEGIMLNVHNRPYEHKRTDALLKYKQVQTIDMTVTNLYAGKGKYEGMCGGLLCYARTEDGREISCEVGSGLSDEQRSEFWAYPEDIIGSIVEVAYHELTQDRHKIDTNLYSLRFPRLKRVRYDKNETSEY